jgi:hypothetical protein
MRVPSAVSDVLESAACVGLNTDATDLHHSVPHVELSLLCLETQ